jgi:hypothetical protein
VAFDVVGLDSGRGLPAPRDFRDHPEAYREGWYPMDEGKLRRALGRNTRLIIGPFEETVVPFVSSLTPEAPVGFVSLDVDYYSSARDALALFCGLPEAYLPYLPVHVDDISFPSHNSKAGEALAIEEFNREHPMRSVERDRFLVHRRIFKNAAWLEQMFTLHVLDHPERAASQSPGQARDPGNPYLGDRATPYSPPARGGGPAMPR